MSHPVVPRPDDFVVAVPAPARGPGNWVGAPSAVEDEHGGFVVAYRMRTADERGSANVVARSVDGLELTPVVQLGKARFGAESLERPALVRTDSGGWRLYVSCATPGTKHWRIDLLEADDLPGLQAAEPRTVFTGDDVTGVKDPVIRRDGAAWQAWVCCHPLEELDEEDRMTTRYATSTDGVDWQWQGTALAGRSGMWDSRGARVTAVLPDGSAAYDGRASKEANFSERTGWATPGDEPGSLVAQGDAPLSDARYLDVVPLRAGGYRLFYEASLPDGSHELRTELVPPG
jgi:hypothetical protein